MEHVQTTQNHQFLASHHLLVIYFPALYPDEVHFGDDNTRLHQLFDK